MEKLQQALHKARSQRQNVQGASAETFKPGAKVDPWSELPGFEPNEALLKRNRVVTYSAGSNATPFDVLRTKIVLQMRKNGWKRLAITSPNAGCGKTTMGCNLTVGLSRQPDIRTILFELDLRKPAMAKMLGMTPQYDVTEVLSGTAGFAEQAVRLRENVAISAANKPAGDPMRYLLSAETDQRLRTIENTYQPDLMIFDLPPILAADDTRAVLSKVDCALIVIRAEKTTVAQIDACEREIAEHTNVLGVVVNNCRFPESSSYEDY